MRVAMQHEHSAGQTPKEKARVACEANRAEREIVKVTGLYSTDADRQARNPAACTASISSSTSPVFPTCQADGQLAPNKTFARLQAQAALAGIAVHALAGGAYLASRWNWPPRELADLDALAKFLLRQGVQV